MTSVPSLAELPTELASQICGCLSQKEISALSLTNKAVYRLIRPLLYYCPTIPSFSALTLFNRTLTQATYLGKLDIRWSIRESLNQTKYLNVILDPTKDSSKNQGQPPPAILISRILHSIERRCPEINIHLRFEHCKCDATPVCNFTQETFPRVRSLIICVGSQDPDETHPRRSSKCAPSTKFFSPFVDGVAFPDCKKLEIRHHWAVAPEKNVSLFPRQRSTDPNGHDHVTYYSPSYHRPAQPPFTALDGLEKLQSITLECVPELDESVMAQLLGNSKMAVNLTSLELRFCILADEAITQLLYHAPLHLRRLVVLTKMHQHPRYYNGEGGTLRQNEIPHLCPLFRKLSKSLTYLEYGANRICRELFFDDLEIDCVAKDGIMTNLGMLGGGRVNDEHLDAHAIRSSVQRCREMKRVADQTKRVHTSLSESQKKSNGKAAGRSLFGGPQDDTPDMVTIKGDVERMMDQEEEQRKRLITSAKTPWFRRYMTWEGMCKSNEAFEELQIAADVEEEGIIWVLANGKLEVASQHARGKLSKEVSFKRAMEELYRVKDQ